MRDHDSRARDLTGLQLAIGVGRTLHGEQRCQVESGWHRNGDDLVQVGDGAPLAIGECGLVRVVKKDHSVTPSRRDTMRLPPCAIEAGAVLSVGVAPTKSNAASSTPRRRVRSYRCDLAHAAGHGDGTVSLGAPHRILLHVGRTDRCADQSGEYLHRDLAEPAQSNHQSESASFTTETSGNP
jgi:hypothetical protein